jgi:hypothetical protein
MSLVHNCWSSKRVAGANSKASGREGDRRGSERQTIWNKMAQLKNPTLPTSDSRPDHAPTREDNSIVRGQCSFHQWCKRTATCPGPFSSWQGTRTPCLQEVPMWQCLRSAAVLATWPEWLLRVEACFESCYERIARVAMAQHFNSRIHQTSVRTEVQNTKWANHHTRMELTSPHYTRTIGSHKCIPSFSHQVQALSK